MEVSLAARTEMELNLRMEKGDHPAALQFKHLTQLYLETNCRVNCQIPEKDHLTGPVWTTHLP